MKKKTAMAIAFILVLSEQFRNRVISHIKECDEDDCYKSYIKFTKKSLQEAIYYFGFDELYLEEFDEELEALLYHFLEKGLEKFGIYTRADGDKLFVRQSIVEIA